MAADEIIIETTSQEVIEVGVVGPQGPQGLQGPPGEATASLPWTSITGKPSTFPPSTHQHVAADVTDFASAVVAAAPPTTNASLLTSGTLPDARLSANIARTSDVTGAVAAVVNAAPASLDTLKELADALGNDANFASTVTNSLASKVGTSDSRLTDSREWSADTISQAEAEAGTATTRRAFTALRVFQAIAAWWNSSSAKTKLDGIATGATANSSDATLLARANHTGTQAHTTITGLGSAATSASTDFAAASHNHAASAITSGVFDNGRINFAAPSAIGAQIPSTGLFTDLSVASRLNLPSSGSNAKDIWVSSGQVRYQAGTQVTSARTLLSAEDNLSNLDNTATARTNLGVGSSSAVTFGSIQNTPIGSTTASTGAFTTLSATPAAGSTALTLTGGTVTTSAPVLDATQTWNASGTTFTALRLNATNTASATASLLMDLQTGGTTQFSVRRDGVINANYYRFTGLNSGLFVHSAGGGVISIGDSPNNWMTLTSTRMQLTGDLSLGRALSLGQSADTILARDAANTVAQVNGTNAQESRLYGTFTSSTNYQRMTVKSARQTLSALSGASATTTGTFIPDGAVVVGVTTRVATLLTGATGYTIGDGTDADRWGDITGTAIGTTSDNRDWTAGTIECFTAGGNVTLTAKTANFTAGAIEICVFYLAGEAD